MKSIDKAIAELQKGNFVLVVDNEKRENEGDLIMLSEKVTPQSVNFMIRHCSGIICCALTKQRAEELHLPLMCTEKENTETHGCAFTVTTDYKFGTTTGVSAYDRCKTIRMLADGSDAVHSDFNKPGHVFPLIAREGGVLERAGHTEAAVDLAKLADSVPCAFLCEIMNPDGTMARYPELVHFSRLHNIAMITIDNLQDYLRN